MKIQTGLEMMNDVQSIEGNCVRFIAADGREMYEVAIGKDGRSLEVRAVNHCKVDGVLYDTSILVAPNVSNCVTISTKPYDA